MRSTIIIATCALAILAVPVPVAEPIYKSSGRSVERDSTQHTRRDDSIDTQILRINDSKRDAEVIGLEARAIRNTGSKREADPEPQVRGGHRGDRRPIESVGARALGARSPSPEPFSRANVQDSSDATLDTRSPTPSPFSRANVQDDSSEPTLETRDAGAFQNIENVQEDIEDLNARGAIRNHGGKRDTEIKDNEDIEARGAIRNHGGKRSPTPGRVRWGGSKRSPAPGRVRWGGRSVCQPELDSNHCGTQEKRSIDGPVNDDGHHAGAEAVDGDLSERAAEAEPVVTGPGAGAGQLCLKGGRWVRC